MDQNYSLFTLIFKGVHEPFGFDSLLLLTFLRSSRMLRISGLFTVIAYFFKVCSRNRRFYEYNFKIYTPRANLRFDSLLSPIFKGVHEPYGFILYGVYSIQYETRILIHVFSLLSSLKF